MLYLYGIYPQNKQPTVGVKLSELQAGEGMQVYSENREEEEPCSYFIFALSMMSGTVERK